MDIQLIKSLAKDYEEGRVDPKTLMAKVCLDAYQQGFDEGVQPRFASFYCWDCLKKAPPIKGGKKESGNCSSKFILVAVSAGVFLTHKHLNLVHQSRQHLVLWSRPYLLREP